MDVYRQRTRSDEKVEPSQFRPGLIVWVPGEAGREQRVCTGVNGDPITIEEHRRRKAQRADENRKNHPHGPWRVPNRPEQYFF